ncbi:uncharacterized protein LOC131157660 [Malania oleifera]|uniref:uncharacterized protein LOC131157660 n=1 Tax=Malania oleifera TaxID=397392 RepID=UPI0025AEC39B|nr:uncharacterized protein LOC131157660 [Malania oleifera]
MEKTHLQRDHHDEEEEGNKGDPTAVWDCDSSLYDSFELKSFKRQLDSAISSRTLSMPHLSHHHPPPPPAAAPKKPWKISRSVNRLLRSVFRVKPQPTTTSFLRVQDHHHRPRDGFYVLCDGSGSLTTIPEVPETGLDYGGLSPELNSLARRTASDRFMAAGAVGIYCA